MKRTAFISFLFVFLFGCSPSTDDTITELTISAAASMMASLIEVEEMFINEYPNIQINYNFGGSGSLRKQIEQGAPIDLFFSASKIDYEKLVDQNLIDEGTSIFENELVFIKSKQSTIASFNDFLQKDVLIAIGTPEAVPAGTYAKEVLQELGVWSELKDRMVFTKDVSQVITFVSEGAVDAGIVYSSDIHEINEVSPLETFDKKLHSPIEYFMSVIENGEVDDDRIQARELFYQFIRGKSAQEVFQRYGFDLEK